MTAATRPSSHRRHGRGAAGLSLALALVTLSGCPRERSAGNAGDGPCARAGQLRRGAARDRDAGRWDRAAEALARAEQLCPGTGAGQLAGLLRAWAGQLERDGYLDRGLALRRHVARSSGEASDARALGHSLEQLGRCHEAGEVLGRIGARPAQDGPCGPGAARQVDLRAAAAAHWAALAARGNGRLDQARQLLERSDRLGGGPEALLELASLLDRRGDRRAARRTRARALARVEGATGKPLRLVLGVAPESRVAAFVFTGWGLPCVVDGAGGRGVQLWDCADGRLLGIVGEPNDRFGAVDEAGHVLGLVTPDSRLRLVELGATGSLLGRAPIPGCPDPRGHWLTWPGADNEMEVFHLPAGRCQSLLGGGAPPAAVAGTRLVRVRARRSKSRVCLGTRIEVRELSGRTVRVVPVGDACVVAVAIDPQGRRLAWLAGAPLAESPEGALLDLAGGARRALPSVPTMARALAFDDSGELLAAGGDTVTLWETQKGAVLRTLEAPASRLALGSSGGNRLLAVALHGAASLWNVKTGQRVRSHGALSAVRSVAVPAPGTLAVVSATGSALWDLRAGRARFVPWAAGSRHPEALAWIGGTRLVVVAGQTVELRDAASGTVRALREASPDARVAAVRGLVAASVNPAIELIDPRRGSLVRRLSTPVHEGGVAHLVPAQDGKHLVSVDGRRVVRLWDPARGALVRTLMTAPVAVTAVAATGSTLALGGQDGTIWVWDLTDARAAAPRLTLQAHRDPVAALAVGSPTGVLASAAGGAIKLWELPSGRQLRALAHPARVTSLALDGDRLLSGGVDGTVSVLGRGREPLASLAAVGPKAWVARTPDGYVDASRQGREHVLWRHGDHLFPWGLGWPRHHVPGLLRRVLAGDDAFRLGRLQRPGARRP